MKQKRLHNKQHTYSAEIKNRFNDWCLIHHILIGYIGLLFILLYMPFLTLISDKNSQDKSVIFNLVLLLLYTGLISVVWNKINQVWNKYSNLITELNSVAINNEKSSCFRRDKIVNITDIKSDENNEKDKEIDKLLSELKSVQHNGWINGSIREGFNNLKLISDKDKVYRIDENDNIGIWLKFSNKYKENRNNKDYVIQLIWIKSRKIRNEKMNRWLDKVIAENGFSKFILITKRDKSLDKNINEDILY